MTFKPSLIKNKGLGLNVRNFNRKINFPDF